MDYGLNGWMTTSIDVFMNGLFWVSDDNAVDEYMEFGVRLRIVRNT